MEVKLERYRIFCTVYETGSFSTAADALYLTQSAVSQHIKALEASLNTVLFIRTHSGIHPTQSGNLLYEYAGNALRLIRSGEKRFTDIASLDGGSLSIGASDTICSHCLMPVLEAFHKKYPGIHLNITNRVTSETVDELKRGKIDIALINLPYRQAEEDHFLSIDKVYPLHDVFVASPCYLTDSDFVLDQKNLSQYPLIMLETKSNTRNYIDSVLSANGYHIQPEFELGSHELLLKFAAASLGIACVTREFAGEYLSSKRLIEVNTDIVISARSLGICRLSGVPLSRAADTFLSMLSVSL